MTTFDPGASDVFTHGFARRPFSTAFFAKSPAPMSTEGFEVFVHEVIAEMTTEPCSRSNPWPSDWTWTFVPAGAGRLPFLSFLSRKEGSVFSQAALAVLSGTRSCGRRGPASD